MRVRAGWAIGLLLIAALEFAVSFAGVAGPIVFTLGCLVPFGIVALARRLGGGVFLPALVTIALAAAGAWFALRRESGGSLGGLGDAVPRLLTTARPADATAALLAPPALLVVLVATVVAACVLGGTDLLAPVAGAGVLYVAAQLLAAGDADPNGIVAVSLLVVTVAGWSHPWLRGGSVSAWRPAALAPLVVVCALALGAAGLTASGAFDPRRHVSPPTVRLDEASPLTQLRSWTANPSVRILRAKVEGATRLHLATLDVFTGAAWQVDSRYQQVGLVTNGDLPAPSRTSAATATIRLERLGGLWLPAPGTATGASLDGALVDADDGTLAGPGLIRPGLTYTVESRVAAPRPDDLAVAAVPTDVPERYLALPDGPVAFATYARAAVRGASTPYEEAVALESAVSTGRRVDPKAASGSSYGRLSTFLFGPKGTSGAGVGTSEQFAAAFALLAREVGLPSRLTVGFDLGKPAADGSVVVRGADASVWPEVYLDGAGWVAFAPTPGAEGGPGGSSLRDDVLQKLSDRAKILPPVDPEVQPTPPPVTNTTAPDAAAQEAARRDRDAGPPAWMLALVIIGGAVLLVLGGLVLLRALRSRRHRRRGATGAWAEIVDLLVLLGQRPPPDRPAPEIAAAAVDVLGERAAVVATAADRSAFGPDPAGDTDADAVWRDVRRVRRRARSTMPRRRRVLLPLDPRPLVGGRPRR